MAVPTKEAFAEYVETLDVPNIDPLTDIEAVARGGVRGVAALLQEVERNREAHRAMEAALEVGRWFESNATAGRAWRSLFSCKKGAPLTLEEIAKRWVEAACRDYTAADYEISHACKSGSQSCEAYLEQRNSEVARHQRLTRTIARRLARPSYEVACSVASAFCGYFHEEAFRRYLLPRRASRAAATELLSAFNCLNDPSNWESAGVLMAGVRLPKMVLADLTQVAAAGGEPAIKKLDATAPERALAFELWSLSRRFFRANRTTAIFNFMQFEGVQNAPDARSVERWVADWRKRRVALAPSHPIIKGRKM